MAHGRATASYRRDALILGLWFPGKAPGNHGERVRGGSAVQEGVRSQEPEDDGSGRIKGQFGTEALKKLVRLVIPLSLFCPSALQAPGFWLLTPLLGLHAWLLAEEIYKTRNRRERSCYSRNDKADRALPAISGQTYDSYPGIGASVTSVFG